MNTVLDELLQLTMEAASKEDFQCEGVRYHVSHLVAVLAKLFVVDERTVDYVLTRAKTNPPSTMVSRIKLFADLLITFSDLITSTDPLNQFTCIALYNIMWSISFQDDYQEELKRNTQVIDTIKRLATDERSQLCDQYKPRALQSIKKAADGILYNLRVETKPRLEKLSEARVPTTDTSKFTEKQSPHQQSAKYQDAEQITMYVSSD